MSLLPDLLMLHDLEPAPQSMAQASHDLAMMLQGAMLAAASHFISDRLEGEDLAIVQQPVRDSGEIQPYFRVMLANGTSLRVQVNVEAYSH